MSWFTNAMMRVFGNRINRNEERELNAYLIPMISLLERIMDREELEEFVKLYMLTYLKQWLAADPQRVISIPKMAGMVIGGFSVAQKMHEEQSFDFKAINSIIKLIDKKLNNGFKEWLLLPVSALFDLKQYMGALEWACFDVLFKSKISMNMTDVITIINTMDQTDLNELKISLIAEQQKIKRQHSPLLFSNVSAAEEKFFKEIFEVIDNRLTLLLFPGVSGLSILSSSNGRSNGRLSHTDAGAAAPSLLGAFF